MAPFQPYWAQWHQDCTPVWHSHHLKQGHHQEKHKTAQKVTKNRKHEGSWSLRAEPKMQSTALLVSTECALSSYLVCILHVLWMLLRCNHQQADPQAETAANLWNFYSYENWIHICRRIRQISSIFCSVQSQMKIFWWHPGFCLTHTSG